MDVAVLYVTHVLVPQGQYSVATQFLTSYTHLNTDMIETIVRDTNTLKGPNANSKGSSAEKIREEEEESCIANEEGKKTRGGGGGVLSFFLHMYAWAQHLPFNPKKYQEFQAPQKIFDILATQKNIPILYLVL